MKILIGADLVPTESNRAWFESGEIKSLLGQELITFLRGADYRIFNLEVPLTDVVAPIDKCGPNLTAPTTTVVGIKAIGADLVTLANNHIMDQGEQGLLSTIQKLQENEIASVGAGENLGTAQKPFIMELDGRRIGVYACAEHEFSIATSHTVGANPFDPLESLDHIAELKRQTDYVIVLHHGGKEHYRYPSPNLQKACRKMIEKGADLVVCQHSHCIGCEEKWQNGTIIYGQGNFLFDNKENEFWQTSLLIELAIDENVSLSYHPLQKQGNFVRLAEGEKAEQILSDFNERSAQIQKCGAVEEKYNAFSQEMFWYYIGVLSGKKTKRIWFRAINKLTGGRFAKWHLKRQHDKETLLRMQNVFECEAHRELVEEGLINAINGKWK